MSSFRQPCIHLRAPVYRTQWQLNAMQCQDGKIGYIIQPSDPFFTFQTLRILVAPNSNQTHAIFDNSSLKSVIEYVNDDTEMVNEYRRNRQAYYAGIVFENTTSQENEVAYAIRYPYHKAPYTNGQKRSERDCYQADGLGDCNANDFVRSGFLTLQAVVDEAILKWWRREGGWPISPNWTIPGVDSWSVEMMPLDFLEANTIAIAFFVPLFLPLTATSFVNSLLVNLVTEKEKKIKDSMRVMGMMESAFWFSWGIVYWIVSILFSIVAIIFLAGSSFFRGDISIVFVLILLYFWSTVSFSFFLSAFMKKAKTAGSLGGFVVFILGFLFLALYIPFMIGSFESTSFIHYIAGLLPPLAFAQVLNTASTLDLDMVTGIHWNDSLNVYPKESGFDGTSREWAFSIQDGMIILVVDIFLYFILALYVENVIPGTLGYRLRFFYFLDPGYWGLSRSQSKVFINDEESVHVISSDIEPIEREFQGKNALKIRSLTKTFMVKQEKSTCCGGKVEKRAVNDLTMDMYEGQITCLLGHNGAGKTTTINILTGLMMPTSGGASYYGYDINSTFDIGIIRAMTGVCPQHDILFDHLYILF